MIFSPAAIAAAVVCLLIACALFAVGIFLRKSNAPIHLWSGALLTKKQITDARRYNRANSMIWFGFGAYMLGCAALAVTLGLLAAVIGAGLLAVLAWPLQKLCAKRIFLRFSASQQDSSGE